ncbi:putative arginine decarboxylase [Mycobacteroides abscessus subsp. abscessus]|nr:putative arginine decarboxylase [Mycobacteroides abscessus subsp. abscessus]
MRQHKQLDLGLSDHRRFLATVSIADRDLTVERLLGSLSAWRAAAEDFSRPRPLYLPSPHQLQLESVMLPRDAFFGPTDQPRARVPAFGCESGHDGA